MKIEKYIGELLFEYDCVIIPGFGGFVCNESPAYIHEGKNQFFPPFKKISFNRNLVNNDGLLSNHIASTDSISYAEANQILSGYVENLKNELGQQSRFRLKDIGTFYLGKENTILFEQDETVNYLKDSFGLSSFYSPAIKREPIERKIERKLKDKVIVPSKENNEQVLVKRRTPVRRYMAVAATLLIAFSLFFVSIKTDILKNTNFAYLNPFGNDPLALYQPDPTRSPDNDVLKDNVRDLIASNNNRNDTMRYLNIMINGNIPLVVSLEEHKAPVAKTNEIKHRSKGNFHVIGGAFAVAENAEKLVVKLKKQGFDAKIIDKKLHMVSYGSFSTREEALEAIEKIRAVQSDVWLMKM